MTLDSTLGTVLQDATSGSSLLNLATGNVTSNANYTAAVSSGTNTAEVYINSGSKLTVNGTSTLTMGNQAFLEGSGTVSGGSVAVNAGGTIIPASRLGRHVHCQEHAFAEQQCHAGLCPGHVERFDRSGDEPFAAASTRR